MSPVLPNAARYQIGSQILVSSDQRCVACLQCLADYPQLEVLDRIGFESLSILPTGLYPI